MHELSDYQKRKLLENPAVEKITEKQVVYTAKFKLWAVGRYLEGDSANEIFDKKGISPKLFKQKYCQSCLKRWKKKFIEEGKESFRRDMRGTSSNSGTPKKPTYEELEAIVAIQREALGYSKK
jgi:transposase